MNDTLEDMIHDIGLDAFKKGNYMVETFQRDMEDSVYLGCQSFTRMLVVLRLFNLKERGG